MRRARALVSIYGLELAQRTESYLATWSVTPSEPKHVPDVSSGFS